MSGTSGSYAKPPARQQGTALVTFTDGAGVSRTLVAHYTYDSAGNPIASLTTHTLADGTPFVVTGGTVLPGPLSEQFDQWIGAAAWEIYAPIGGGAINATADYMIDLGIAAGTQRWNQEGYGAPVVDRTHTMLAKVEVSVKPVGRETFVTFGVPATTSTARARINRGGGGTLLGAGDTATIGPITGHHGFRIQVPLYDLVIDEGTAAIVAVEFASWPNFPTA